MICNKKRKLIRPLCVMLMLVGTCIAAAATVDITKNLEYSKLENNFDSALWEQAHTIKGFKVAVDHETYKPASEETVLRMAHDGENIYMLIQAADKSIGDIKADPSPVDGYLNKFPSGDHVELVINTRNKFILAFDCNGNKYLSRQYAPEKYCWYGLATRKTDKGWDAIVTIPFSRLAFGTNSKKRNITFQAVRHIDHGEGTERSFAKGRSLLDIIRFSLKDE